MTDSVEVSLKQLKGEVKQRNLFRQKLIDVTQALNAMPNQSCGSGKTTYVLVNEIETLLKENP